MQFYIVLLLAAFAVLALADYEKPKTKINVDARKLHPFRGVRAKLASQSKSLHHLPNNLRKLTSYAPKAVPRSVVHTEDEDTYEDEGLMYEKRHAPSPDRPKREPPHTQAPTYWVGPYFHNVKASLSSESKRLHKSGTGLAHKWLTRGADGAEMET